MKLDREKLEEQKGMQNKAREKLNNMIPMIRFRPHFCNVKILILIDVDCGKDYKQAKGNES